MEHQAAREAAKNAPAQEAPAKKKKLSSGTLPFDQLQSASERIGQLMDEIDEKELRLLELYDSI